MNRFRNVINIFLWHFTKFQCLLLNNVFYFVISSSFIDDCVILFLQTVGFTLTRGDSLYYPHIIYIDGIYIYK